MPRSCGGAPGERGGRPRRPSRPVALRGARRAAWLPPPGGAPRERPRAVRLLAAWARCPGGGGCPSGRYPSRQGGPCLPTPCCRRPGRAGRSRPSLREGSQDCDRPVGASARGQKSRGAGARPFLGFRPVRATRGGVGAGGPRRGRVFQGLCDETVGGSFSKFFWGLCEKRALRTYCFSLSGLLLFFSELCPGVGKSVRSKQTLPLSSPASPVGACRHFAPPQLALS